MFPKLIWLYWDKGFEDAPEIVKVCLESWEQLNPEFVVRPLSDKNLDSWIDLNSLAPYNYDLPIQKKANIIRKALLVEYGGIWVDSTVLCITPLQKWLPSMSNAGFVLFRNNSKNRILSNWFIVSEKENKFIKDWLEEYIDYFKYKKKINSFFLKKINTVLVNFTTRNLFLTRFWTLRLVKYFWPTYPYFISHFIAQKILRKKYSSLRQQDYLLSAPKGSLFRHRIPLLGSNSPHDYDFETDISSRETWVIKLNHRQNSLPRIYLDDKIPAIRAWLANIK